MKLRQLNPDSRQYFVGVRAKVDGHVYMLRFDDRTDMRDVAIALVGMLNYGVTFPELELMEKLAEEALA